MKIEKSKTRSTLEEVINAFNENCIINDLNENFSIEYDKIQEAIEINGKTGLVKIGRISLRLLKLDDNKDLKGLLLFKRDYPLPNNKPIKDITWQEGLSKELLYEMIGNFCMVTRAMTLDKIKRIELKQAIDNKIEKEESEILNKPDEEKNEEDKVFALMENAKKVKIQKTGLIDKFGADYVSETISE